MPLRDSHAMYITPSFRSASNGHLWRRDEALEAEHIAWIAYSDGANALVKALNGFS